MFASSVAAHAAQSARWLGKVLVLLGAIAGAGCGQKGPLTLPSAPSSAASAAQR